MAENKHDKPGRTIRLEGEWGVIAEGGASIESNSPLSNLRGWYSNLNPDTRRVIKAITGATLIVLTINAVGNLLSPPQKPVKINREALNSKLPGAYELTFTAEREGLLTESTAIGKKISEYLKATADPNLDRKTEAALDGEIFKAIELSVLLSRAYDRPVLYSAPDLGKAFSGTWLFEASPTVYVENLNPTMAKARWSLNMPLINKRSAPVIITGITITTAQGLNFYNPVDNVRLDSKAKADILLTHMPSFSELTNTRYGLSAKMNITISVVVLGKTREENEFFEETGLLCLNPSNTRGPQVTVEYTETKQTQQLNKFWLDRSGFGDTNPFNNRDWRVIKGGKAKSSDNRISWYHENTKQFLNTHEQRRARKLGPQAGQTKTAKTNYTLPRARVA